MRGFIIFKFTLKLKYHSQFFGWIKRWIADFAGRQCQNWSAYTFWSLFVRKGMQNLQLKDGIHFLNSMNSCTNCSKLQRIPKFSVRIQLSFHSQPCTEQNKWMNDLADGFPSFFPFQTAKPDWFHFNLQIFLWFVLWILIFLLILVGFLCLESGGMEDELLFSKEVWWFL